MFLQFKIYNFKGHQVKIEKIKSKNKTKPPIHKNSYSAPAKKNGSKNNFQYSILHFQLIIILLSRENSERILVLKH